MKSWHPDIRQHIDDWSAKLGNRGWWPRFVYHFTDVRNAVRILSAGELLSRAEAQRRGVMAVDNASPQVIGHTQPEHLEFVRLYFRPRTPTQYNNEGIRPTDQRKLGGAHCPVPVYFCFDAFSVLTLDEAMFSDGNIGSARVNIRDDRDFFKAIPFQLVFHNSAFYPEDRDEIVFRRNAEVLIPNRLSLKPHLKFIVCRSSAEQRTLLHLLPDRTMSQWAEKIMISINPAHGLFERKWTYVERVVAESEKPRVRFDFNPSTIAPGPFHLRFTYREHPSGPTYTLERDFDPLSPSLTIALREAEFGEATLWLDDALAFQDMLHFSDIPF